MQTKHFVNDATALVGASLKSLCITNPNLSLDIENKIIYENRSQDAPSQVSIISGGGAGHEPSFSGFVGSGLLSAAVSGSVFASPSSQQVVRAIENVDSTKGVLVTVMNYTGDVLNFGVAVEKARARNPDTKIEMLVVGDDVAVPRSRAGKVGRRGIAGTVLVHKVTGAMAATGYDLKEIVRVGRLISQNLVSIGVSLGRVHVPGRPAEEAEEALASSDIELGMGIHNETGCGKRNGKDAELPAIIGEMLTQMLSSDDQDRAFLSHRCKDMILLVNNLGALSVLELGAVVTETVDQLERDYQINTVRVMAGTFMTSLDGPGFSLSLLNITDLGLDVSLVDLIDAPSNAQGWHTPQITRTSAKTVNGGGVHREEQENGQRQWNDQLVCDLTQIKSRLRSGLEVVVECEPEVTQYDEIVGDGDCGTTLRRGSEAILKELSNSKSHTESLVTLLSQVTSAVESTMDGTSGALYTIFLNSLLHHVKLRSDTAVTVDAKFWSDALVSALKSMSRYTPAQVGDRTMMDALIPFSETLRTTESLQEAAAAARTGAMKTKSMRPGLGRSVYIGGDENWLGKIPDPGAWGLSKFLEGLAR